jgi:hypothetical protein
VRFIPSLKMFKNKKRGIAAQSEILLVKVILVAYNAEAMPQFLFNQGGGLPFGRPMLLHN